MKWGRNPILTPYSGGSGVSGADAVEEGEGGVNQASAGAGASAVRPGVSVGQGSAGPRAAGVPGATTNRNTTQKKKASPVICGHCSKEIEGSPGIPCKRCSRRFHPSFQCMRLSKKCSEESIPLLSRGGPTKFVCHSCFTSANKPSQPNPNPAPAQNNTNTQRKGSKRPGGNAQGQRAAKRPVNENAREHNPEQKKWIYISCPSAISSDELTNTFKKVTQHLIDKEVEARNPTLLLDAKKRLYRVTLADEAEKKQIIKAAPKLKELKLAPKLKESKAFGSFSIHRAISYQQQREIDLQRELKGRKA